jgi:ketosteroid isomerase-like protein
MSNDALDQKVRDQVRSANLAFYDAHERASLPAMQRIWEHSARVVCVHPGWPILRGWSAVEDSWRRILGGPGRSQFILTNEEISVSGDMAWVTVDENLMSPQGALAVAATNVFSHHDDGWRLVIHHGSPMFPHGISPAAEQQ